MIGSNYKTSRSILKDNKKVKFKNVSNEYCYRFPFLRDKLGRTSLVKQIIDTGDSLGCCNILFVGSLKWFLANRSAFEFSKRDYFC